MKKIWLGIKTAFIIAVGASLGAIMITVGLIASLVGALSNVKVDKENKQ